MTRIKISLAFIVLILSALWLWADPMIFSSPDPHILHMALLNYTGIIAMGMLSIGMLLAVRIAKINSMLGGLDKSYRLHKWLGIAGLVVAIIHWLLTKLPQWLLGWEELEPPAVQANPILSFFQQQYHLAVEIGDVDFKIFVVLVTLALVKRFPYRYFFKTHRLLAIVYLLLVVHSVLLMNFDYWDELIAPVMMALMAGGTIAAFISLFRKIGHRRSAVGVIDEMNYLEQSSVLKVVIAFKDRWPGHKAGQFAFVTFDRKEGPHPYTISSPWTDNGKMFFLIKALGDYTSGLQDKLKTGDYVKVEGPYGQFNFSSEKDRQIWVAGGIGITPFVARMKALAKESEASDKEIDLFYCTNAIDEILVDKVRKSADAAGVRLHIIVSSRDGRLDFNRICELVPNWRQADIWFCGPEEFGAGLKKDAMEQGVAADSFHQELFEMR